jgi:hypothetical protein
MPMLLELSRRKRLASDDLKELEVLQTKKKKKKNAHHNFSSLNLHNPVKYHSIF